MKDVTITHTFEHTFSLVSLASWLKYPTETRPDVLCVDLLDYQFDAQNHKLYTRRLLTMRPMLPSWFSLFGLQSGNTYCIEEAVVDAPNKTMVLQGRNITMNNIMELRETCTYTRHPTNDSWTHFSHKATAVAFPWLLKDRLEQWTLDRFLQNAARGRELMEATVETIKHYGLDTMLEIKSKLNDARLYLKEGSDQITQAVSQNVENIDKKVAQLQNTIKNL